MEIYNIAKYQNIADRIKRLASLNKTVTKPSEIVSPKYNSKQQNNYFDRSPVIPSGLISRMRYQEKQSQSRVPTQETEQKSEQQSMSLISELITMRQTPPYRAISREKIFKNSKVFQDQQNSYEKVEERSTYKRSVQTQIIQDETKLGLPKIKSENSLKIDEILNNYNNYKQNKQQFLQSINKISNVDVHQRMVNQNIKDYFQNREQPRKTKIKDMAFEEIDNLWNQKQVEDDSTPKFMRSKQQRKDQFAQLTQLLNSELQQKSKDEPKSQIFVKGKLVLRRLQQKKENQNSEQTFKINIVMSPRGVRVPGKICKNSDKFLGVLPNYK